MLASKASATGVPISDTSPNLSPSMIESDCQMWLDVPLPAARWLLTAKHQARHTHPNAVRSYPKAQSLHRFDAVQSGD